MPDRRNRDHTVSDARVKRRQASSEAAYLSSTSRLFACVLRALHVAMRRHVVLNPQKRKGRMPGTRPTALLGLGETHDGKRHLAWKLQWRARVVSFSPDPARNGLPGETLLLIDIIDAEGLVIIQTVWATTPDRGRGHRLTRFEDVADQATLIQRLAELTPVLWPTREPIAAARKVAIAQP